MLTLVVHNPRVRPLAIIEPHMLQTGLDGVKDAVI